MAKNKAVFGIYGTQAGVENAVGMLRDERFSSSDVAVLLPEAASNRDLGTVKASKARRRSADTTTTCPSGTRPWAAAKKSRSRVEHVTQSRSDPSTTT